MVYGSAEFYIIRKQFHTNSPEFCYHTKSDEVQRLNRTESSKKRLKVLVICSPRQFVTELQSLERALQDRFSPPVVLLLNCSLHQIALIQNLLQTKKNRNPKSLLSRHPPRNGRKGIIRKLTQDLLILTRNVNFQYFVTLSSETIIRRALH